jgi:hypothetical protein
MSAEPIALPQTFTGIGGSWTVGLTVVGGCLFVTQDAKISYFIHRYIFNSFWSQETISELPKLPQNTYLMASPSFPIAPRRIPRDGPYSAQLPNYQRRSRAASPLITHCARLTTRRNHSGRPHHYTTCHSTPYYDVMYPGGIEWLREAL